MRARFRYLGHDIYCMVILDIASYKYLFCNAEIDV